MLISWISYASTTSRAGFASVYGDTGTRLRSASARSAASCSRTSTLSMNAKSPRFVDRRGCGAAGQFYNVFYMMGQEYDEVEVGSGAAGMVAALTAAHQGLSTVVVEKAPHYGGSTARSGGGVWIPNNEVLKRDGVQDSPAAAAEYLHTIIGDAVPAEKIDTYLQRGPEMLSFVLKNSPLKMCWVPG